MHQKFRDVLEEFYHEYWKCSIALKSGEYVNNAEIVEMGDDYIKVKILDDTPFYVSISSICALHKI